MLEGVDDVPWSRLSAWGDATVVPGLLRALAAAPSGEVDRLWSEMDDVLLHQGEPSECSVYAVPFLVELAEAPTACRDRALSSLRHAALYLDYVDVFGLHWLDDWGFADEGLGPASTWLADGGLWQLGTATDALNELSYRAVASERHRIARLIDDDDPIVRLGSTQVLAALGLEADEVLPVLWARFDVEADGVVRAHLCAGIGELGLCVAEERKADVAHRLLLAAEAEPDEVVRVVAWTAAALVAPKVVPTAVHERFVDSWDRAGAAWNAARRGCWPYPLPELWQAWARAHRHR